MKQLLLNPPEIASLLLLSVAVSDVLSGRVTPDTLEELSVLHGDLERILYKEESPLH